MGTGKTMGHAHLRSPNRREGSRSWSPAIALELGWPRGTCPLWVTGPLATSTLAYGEESGCCLPDIERRDLSRGCCSSHLVHIALSSVSRLPRGQGQAGGRAPARLIPAWTGAEAGLCSQAWGLRSARRGPPLTPNICVPVGKSLKVMVP